jgi:predicted N-acetyltransferase YhbS
MITIAIAGGGQPRLGSTVCATRGAHPRVRQYRAPLALVADLDGAIVGHVMVCDTALHHAGGRGRISMLSPLACAGPPERTGSGWELVRRLCASPATGGRAARRPRGEPLYYGRFGSSPARRTASTPHPRWATATRADPVVGEIVPTLTGRVGLHSAFDAWE